MPTVYSYIGDKGSLVATAEPDHRPDGREAPLVSILTPSLNQGRWLLQNLKSVERQTYRRVEHVVMDGGSTDESLEILAAAGKAVRWESSPDRGQSHALNKALGLARGSIIGWINSDDAYFDARAIEDAVSVFNDDPSVDVVYGHAAMVNAVGRVIQLMWVPPFSRTLLLRYNYIVQPSVFIRRSAIEGKFIDERFQTIMDGELWIRLSTKSTFRRLDRIVSIDRHYLARKSMARPDLTASDQAKLRAVHGVHRSGGPTVRAVKIVFRLMGLTLLRGVAQPSAFDPQPDARWKLVFRQTLMKRKWMPGIR